ncbi:TetR family transcriptional regulator C-terminal domain-containing protein [Rubrobacter radiotolerans]|uniref:TetR family transcriptional regulator C-terminal domain-containing protein n=1 Tax=Rubrobacter radiotolerans TaxID=42256 RepID=A0AB35T678_RUBRA|nr:TetR family transcriptional regulator C-terminal domain-containing protein [Rubrobacter radiotolerans]MDX5895404.1 TetR family transcriptional regulator C-terminal domain-containing protein [Rubrobacter radiotolerans]
MRLLRTAKEAGQVGEDLDADLVVRRLLSAADGLAVRVLIGQLGAPEAVSILHNELESVLE